MFVDYAEEVEFGKDQEVIKEGDGSGDETMYFYIVKSGRCKFTQKGQGDIGGCGPGDSFGELALLSNCPRAATVTATEKCKMYQVDRSTFRFMMKEAAIHQTEEVMEFLQKLDILANLDDAQMEVVASAVIAQDFRAGEKVFSEGDEGNIFYMMQSGSVAVRTDKPGMDDVRIMAGNYFGDAALTTGEARNATIECVEPCRLLLLSREDFDKDLNHFKYIKR